MARLARVFRVWVRVYDPVLHRAVPRSVEARCAYCGSTLGKVVFGSVHVYFRCWKCEEWTDLGIRG